LSQLNGTLNNFQVIDYWQIRLFHQCACSKDKL
jgi:hypothetical protein